MLFDVGVLKSSDFVWGLKNVAILCNDPFNNNDNDNVPVLTPPSPKMGPNLDRGESGGNSGFGLCASHVSCRVVSCQRTRGL